MTSSATSMASPASLVKLELSLTELARLGRTMIDAIEAGDDARLVAAMQLARGVRAGLTGRLPAAEGAGAVVSHDALARLRRLVSAAQVTEQIADRWLARPLPPDRELLDMPNGDVFLADVMLPGVWDFQRDLVVLVGPGMARLADALRHLGQERILWYHADPGAAREESSVVLRVEHLDEVAAAVRGFGLEAPERLAVRAIDPAQGDLCAEVAARVKAALSDTRIQRNTIATFNRTWLEQGLENLGALCRWPSVAALDGALAGKPLVVIAPGPSLARNIHLLAGLQGKAVLLAVSHALTPLTRAGVTPDFAIAVDPQDLRYHFAGSPIDRVGGIIAAATVHPELFRLGAPSYFTLSGNGVLDDWLCDLIGERTVVPGGGSVATTALALALRWRCNPIAMVGLDLSFPGGQYYIDTSCDGGTRAVISQDGRTVSVEGWSAEFHRMKETSRHQLQRERLVELPGWYGPPVQTSFMFTLFHRWFEERVRHEGEATEIFNCTEGGARIAGMNHVPLAEFARRIAGQDVDVRSAIASAVNARDVDEHRRNAARGLNELIAALRRCRALARRAERAAERMARRDGSADALGRAEQALIQVLRPLELLSMMAQAEIGQALVVARDVISVDEALSVSIRLFAEVERAAGWLAPRVVEAQGTLAASMRGPAGP